MRQAAHLPVVIPFTPVQRTYRPPLVITSQPFTPHIRPSKWQRLLPPNPMSLLTTDEVCRLQVRMHWLPMVKHIAIAVAMMFITSPMVWFIVTSTVGWWLLHLLVALVVMVLEGRMVYDIFHYRSNRITITNHRFLHTSGILRRRVEERNLSRRTDLTIDQSILGVWLDYGHFRFEMAGRHDDGAQRETVRFVPRPYEVYRAMGVSCVTATTAF
ncbi:MAG: PH domain-containing protein [Candidatus Binatia bacterium]